MGKNPPIALEDVLGIISKSNTFFQFINHNCQWYIGIPLLLLYAFLKDCYGFFFLNMSDIPIGRLWVTGILCLLVFLLYWWLAFNHGSAKNYRFHIKK